MCCTNTCGFDRNCDGDAAIVVDVIMVKLAVPVVAALAAIIRVAIMIALAMLVAVLLGVIVDDFERYVRVGQWFDG